MTNILALSGKKEAGKNAFANWCLGNIMSALDIVLGGFTIKEDGKLYISDLFGETDGQGRFDYYRKNDIIDKFKEEYLSPYIKLYSFADELKAFCVNVLNLSPEQVYGTNEQKNSLTHLKWEDMPGIIPVGFQQNCIDWLHYRMMFAYPEPKEGLMTGREVLQYFGTNIVRKMYGPAWANATLNKIEKENTVLAIITDCRFVDEVELTQKKNGRVLRFLRNPHKDTHKSETALDDYPLDKFDCVIEDGLDLETQNNKAASILKEWGWISDYEVVG